MTSALLDSAKPAAVARPEPIRVCLLISSLEFGGAERQVVELMRTFDRERLAPFVCSLSHDVPLAPNLPHPDRDLVVIEKKGRFDVTTVFRVARVLRTRRVQVVHAFLFDAEMVARLAAPLGGVAVTIGSERNADYTPPRIRRIAQRLTRPLLDAMIANSHAGRRFAARTFGVEESRIHVVHNGVDIQRFRPDPDAGRAFRDQHGIPPGDPVIGMVGNFKRQKGHDYFLHMAARVAEARPESWFLVVGGGVKDAHQGSDAYETEIRELAQRLGLKRCLFLGSQDQMRAVYNACTLTALLSRHEGTPNVVLESMACGVPVIASDVADNALILREGLTGHVVPKGDFTAAAAHALRLLADPAGLRRMADQARDHARTEFSLARSAENMEGIYRNLLARRSPRQR